MADEEMETRILMIPLGITLKGIPRRKRAPRAIKEIRKQVAKAMKEDETAIWIFGDVNEAIWARGIQRPPVRIKVIAKRIEEGHVEVSIPTEEELAE